MCFGTVSRKKNLNNLEKEQKKNLTLDFNNSVFQGGYDKFGSKTVVSRRQRSRT